MKKGDILYCIKGNDEKPIHPKLKKGQFYTSMSDSKSVMIFVEGIFIPLHNSRFITISKLRKLKLDNIFNV